MRRFHPIAGLYGFSITFAALLVLPLSPLTSRIVSVSTYPALHNACQNALPGDTIIVAAGIYTISGASRIMITNRPGPVLVSGATGDPSDVVIRGLGQNNASVQMAFNLDHSPYWTFEHITTRETYYHGFKFDHNSTDCVLRDVIMLDHGESGVKGTSDPSSGQYPDRLLVESCTIGFTQPTGGTRSVVEGVDGVGVNDWIICGSRFVNIQKNGNPAYAIFTKGNSSNTIIERNIFLNCFIGASFGGGGTAPQYFRDNDTEYEHRNGIIRNNIIIRTTDAGVYINKGKNCRIYNNTLFECVLTIQLRFQQSSGYVRNNLVKRSPSNPNEPIIRLRDGAIMLANESNLTAQNSYFLQPAGPDSLLDLHLKQGSAPVNGGVNVSPDVTDDYDGYGRPAGGAYDVGAYEFGAVPVELERFTVSAGDDFVILQWSTISETNNAGFQIERQMDTGTAGGWTRRGFVAGHGTTRLKNDYSFSDPTPDPQATGSTIRYRLRQIDYDGSFEFSPVVEVILNHPAQTVLSIYPNPSSGSETVRLAVSGQSIPFPARIRIIDLLGRCSHDFLLDSSPRRVSEVLLDGRTLSAGLHSVTLVSTTGIHSTMLVRF